MAFGFLPSMGLAVEAAVETRRGGGSLRESPVLANERVSKRVTQRLALIISPCIQELASPPCSCTHLLPLRRRGQQHTSTQARRECVGVSKRNGRPCPITGLFQAGSDLVHTRRRRRLDTSSSFVGTRTFALSAQAFNLITHMRHPPSHLRPTHP